jgi:hypothetical protein
MVTMYRSETVGGCTTGSAAEAATPAESPTAQAAPNRRMPLAKIVGTRRRGRTPGSHSGAPRKLGFDCSRACHNPSDAQPGLALVFAILRRFEGQCDLKATWLPVLLGDVDRS